LEATQAPEQQKLSSSVVIKYSVYSALLMLAPLPLGQFLNVFYTNVVGMTPAVLATILLIARIIDFIATFLVGGIIENSRFKSGKYLPWLGFTKYLIYAGCILIFLPMEMNLYLQAFIMIVAYVMAYTLLSFVTTSQYGILSLICGTSLEKRNTLVIAGYRTSTAINVVAITTVPYVRQFLTNIPAIGARNAYIIMAASYGLLYLICISILANLAKPHDGPQIYENAQAAPKIRVADMIRAIGQNNQLIIYLLSSVVNFIGMMTPMYIAIYYFMYVLGDMDLTKYYPLNSLITMLFGVVASLIGPKVGLKLGRKMARVAGTGTAALAMTLLIFFGHLSIWVYIPIMCLNSVAMSFYSGFAVSYIIDVGQYGYWKTGIDNRTVTNSLVNIPMKISTFIGGSLGLYGLQIIGWTPDIGILPTDMMRKFMLLFGGIPAACYLIGSLMTLFFYKIGDKEAQLYVTENAKRDAEKAAAGQTD